MNRGFVCNIYHAYAKRLQLNRAVLWKDRELSIPEEIFGKILKKGLKEMHYIDAKKEEVWIFDTDEVKDKSYLKQAGQEQQIYFSIDLVKKKVPLDEYKLKWERLRLKKPQKNLAN